MNTKYPIGTRYKARKKEWVVVDYYTTTNNAGEVVKFRYVGVTDLLGQKLFDHEVNDVTIARGVINEN